jgi:hypothetical protein
VQPASPEVPSLPEKATVSSSLYHPLLSGARLGLAVAAGAVASCLTLTEVVRAPSLFHHVQETGAPAVSIVIVDVVHLSV